MPDPLPLSELDKPRPFAVRPETLERNLAAMAPHHSVLTEALRATELPPSWQPVLGLDDWPTWNIDGQWWGNTAAPWSRAESLVSMVGPDHSIALTGIGTGAELVRLRERLGNLQAIFVFESNPIAIAAVLKTTDLSRWIADRRLVIVADADPSAALTSLLSEHPGLLPPVRMVALPDDPPERLNQLRDLCEPVAQRIIAARQEKLQQYAGAPAAAGSGFAFLALSTDPLRHAIADALHTAAERAGANSCSLTVARPDAGHLLGPTHLLQQQCPDVVVSFGPLLEDVVLPAGATVVHWVPHVPATLPSDGWLLPGTPEASKVLREKLPKRVLCDLWLGAERHNAPLPTRCGERIVVCADLPETDPTRLGIQQPTHRLIWRSLQEIGRAALRSGQLLAPAALLDKAESNSRLRLESNELRTRMTQIIAHNLIPTLVLETISGVLEESGIHWEAVGHGLQRNQTLATRCVSDTLRDLSEQQWDNCPRAILIADPSNHADVLAAGARGWPLVLLRCDPRQPPIDPQLLPTDHYRLLPVASVARLLPQLTRMDQTGDLQMAHRAAAHVRRHHNWDVRFAQLLTALSAP